MLSVVILNVVLLSVNMMGVIMLNVVRLHVVMLSVIKLNVVMLNVMVPYSLFCRVVNDSEKSSITSTTGSIDLSSMTPTTPA